MSDRETAMLDYDPLTPFDSDSLIGTVDHPKHGIYYVWHSGGLYGISRDEKKPHCGYASLSALFATKGL